ncbi:MAG: T9SS type A sorting domain-containing protein [Bacteroidetes bacterium]|nr:T9SS type A sorting domain-containing protein [Bacteroidota bacterium]
MYEVTMRYIRSFFAALALLLFAASGSVQAQVSALPFQQFLGTYTPLGAGGTSLPTLASYDDAFWTFTLPFPVTFNGATHTIMYVGTNGYVTFGVGTTTLGGIISSTLNFNAGGGAVAAFSADMHGRQPVKWAVSGIAPNRVLTVEYENWTRFSATGTGLNDFFNWQFKFYETSGMIEIVYGDWIQASTPYTGQVGVRGQLNTDFNNRSVSSTANTWLTSTAGTTNTASCEISSTFAPPRGLTYRWGCFVPKGVVDISLSDANGVPQAYFYTPGSITVNYTVAYPLDQAYNVPITLNFYRVGDASGIPTYTESFVAQKPLGVLNGSHTMNLTLPTGYYNVEAVFSVYNNCLFYEGVTAKSSTLFILPGTTLCEVWPGDTDNNGLVSYADRAALNKYIYDANLSPLWLQGPARYLAAAENNPLAYLEWTPQASIPWNTPDGCYKDTDGNGVINNFDYIAIKLNWQRAKGSVPAKQPATFSALTFDMDQNYPNPFNPTTSIRFAVPERSQVRLVVTDMLGREIATLVNDAVDAGVHTAQFDAGQLPSGNYIATVSMAGFESGLTFSKTVKMALNK